MFFLASSYIYIYTYSMWFFIYLIEKDKSTKVTKIDGKLKKWSHHNLVCVGLEHPHRSISCHFLLLFLFLSNELFYFAKEMVTCPMFFHFLTKDLPFAIFEKFYCHFLVMGVPLFFCHFIAIYYKWQHFFLVLTTSVWLLLGSMKVT